MHIIVTTREEAAKLAVEQYAVLLSTKPKSTLGFATGSTPLALYMELARAYQRSELSFSQATSFNLDEYVGLEENNPQSYRYFMNQNLFSKIDIPLEHTNVPSGETTSTAKADKYEALIQAAGGIDLQLLGIGQNGHIGFNEPDVKFEKGTHHVRLTQSTIEANARFFSTRDEVPKSAISMGIKTIMSARRILLLASGPEKAEAIRGAVMGAVTPDLPASVLQLHPNATLIADEAASAEIMRIK